MGNNEKREKNYFEGKGRVIGNLNLILLTEVFSVAELFCVPIPMEPRNTPTPSFFCGILNNGYSNVELNHVNVLKCSAGTRHEDTMFFLICSVSQKG